MQEITEWDWDFDAVPGGELVACCYCGGVGPGIEALCILARSFLLPLALKPPLLSFFQDPSRPLPGPDGLPAISCQFLAKKVFC
jgi:hypothetical protein